MADLSEIAARLFEDVMAPMVLGGAVRPGHAIGGRSAAGLAAAADAVDAGAFDRVQTGRVRRARRLAPIDALPPATGAEWALMAALNDVLQATNPSFDGVLRRSSASRILEVATQTLAGVPAPGSVSEALSRHTWLARLLDLTRTDTDVSWWTGSRTFRGVRPPPRLQAWPELRRVSVVATPRSLLELTPLAVDADRLAEAVAQLLERSPLTDLATCARKAPAFAWSASTLALAASPEGRRLALRALQGQPAGPLEAALGRATRPLLAKRAPALQAALALLGERMLALAMATAGRTAAAAGGDAADAELARGLGAVAATHLLRAGAWSDAERAQAMASLGPLAASPAGREAEALFEGSP